MLEAAEVADDPRQRRRDDRLVQGREQHPEQQARENDQRPEAAEQVGAIVAQRKEAGKSLSVSATLR